MNKMPKDPVMLLSFVNTQLRDYYASLEALCDAFETDRTVVEGSLSSIGYVYDREQNQFR